MSVPWSLSLRDSLYCSLYVLQDGAPYGELFHVPRDGAHTGNPSVSSGKLLCVFHAPSGAEPPLWGPLRCCWLLWRRYGVATGCRLHGCSFHGAATECTLCIATARSLCADTECSLRGETQRKSDMHPTPPMHLQEATIQQVQLSQELVRELYTNTQELLTCWQGPLGPGYIHGNVHRAVPTNRWSCDLLTNILTPILMGEAHRA